VVARRRDLSTMPTIQRTLARRFCSSRARGAETATEQDVVEPPRDSSPRHAGAAAAVQPSWV